MQRALRGSAVGRRASIALCNAPFFCTFCTGAGRFPGKLWYLPLLKATRHQSSAAYANNAVAVPPPCSEEGDFIDEEVDDLLFSCGPSGEQREVEGIQFELGVTRGPEIPEGQRFSRLNVPLSSASSGVEKVRPNSRGTLQPLVSDAVEVPQPTEKAMEKQPLPYDDERFAEMLLEMEVEGSVDETWQDGRKAHVEDVKEIVEVLRSLKVRDICAIDVSEKTCNFDYMLFATCEGPRHIHLAAWAVQEADALKRVSKIRRKQVDHTWEVVPVGRIIVNLLQESLRDELTLERKWAVTKCMDPLNAANAPVSEGRSVRAHGLWTLTLNLQDLEDFEVDYCKDVLMMQV